MASSEDKIHECGTVLIDMLNRLEKVEQELAKLKPDYSQFILDNLGDEIDGD